MSLHDAIRGRWQLANQATSMIEDGAQTGFPVAGPAESKVGWYRSRNTGQRRYWNGVAWIDIASAITPFTFEPEQPVSPPPPPPSSAAREELIDKRSKRIALSAAALGVLAIVGVIVVSNTQTVPLSTNQTVPSTPSPSEPTFTAPLAATTTTLPLGATFTAPLAATTIPVPLAATTTATLPAITKAPPTFGIGSPAVTSPTVLVPSPASGNVAVIGDSITELAASALDHVLRHYLLFIDAANGTRMADHLSMIRQLLSDGQSWDWVIELGTNDAFLLPLNPNWASDFANEAAALLAQPCVVFVTVNPTLGSISTGIDEAIANAVVSHPNFHLLDWGNIEFRKAGWLQSDKVHPTKSGDTELAKLEHNAILGCSGK